VTGVCRTGYRQAAEAHRPAVQWVAMTRSRHTLLPLVLLGGSGLAAAVLALVVFGAFLPVLIEEREAPGPAVRPARPAEARAAFEGAATALRAGDHEAYDAALPASGPAARRALDEIYRHVARLPWTGLRLAARPVPGVPGRFDVRVAGELGHAAPRDRIVAERILDVAVLGDRVIVRGDHTPRDVARQNVMAFDRPVAIRRNGCIVIADKSEEARAGDVARACGPARARLGLLGITSREPVVIYYYASRTELRRSLGGGPLEPRIRFFSHAPDRISRATPKTRDIGVLGPALDGQDAWMPLMLAHELTHAYTAGWFARTKHAPTLLAEGLATAVEGGRTYQPLRDDLASGDPDLPLLTAMASGSLWSGNPIDKVRLGYLEGGSLVLYVLDRWGLAGLRRFVTAVSDSDLSKAGIGGAVRDSLSTGWEEFYTGWVEYVQTLP